MRQYNRSERMECYNDIVKRCRAKDNDAQMKFYSIFCNKVFSSSVRILGDRMEAEEVMQESILKVLTRTELLQDNRETMEAMLRRIAINHSIDLCRQRRLEIVELTERHEKQAQETDYIPTGITIENIKQAIGNLPQGSRIILNLKLIEGYDNDEIAEILHTSNAAVRTQYSRARKKLAETLRNILCHETGIE